MRHDAGTRLTLAYPRRARCAMTLIELMIVVVCITIAGMLVIPAIGSSNPSRLSKAAQLLAADLQFAQLRTMHSSSDPITVVVDASGSYYYLAAASDSTTPITNPADNRPYSVQFGQGRAAMLNGVSIQSVSFAPGNQLSYGAFGSLSGGSDQTITLAAGSNTITLTIAGSTGKVSIGQIQ